MKVIYWPLSLLGLIAVLSAFIGFRLGWLDIRLTLAALVIGLAVGLLAGMASLASILKSKARYQKVDPKLILAVLVGLSPALMVIGSMGTSGLSKPLIHDITTDTENPPAFQLALAERTANDNSLEYAGEEIAIQQHNAYPGLETLTLKAKPRDVEQSIKRYIGQQGWRELRAGNDSHSSRSIEAVATTQIMRFQDDIVFRLMPSEQSTKVDIRSASRVGKGDLGANAGRIKKALNYLNSQFPEQLEERRKEALDRD
mgnify:CR=1 FL=1